MGVPLLFAPPPAHECGPHLLLMGATMFKGVPWCFEGVPVLEACPYLVDGLHELSRFGFVLGLGFNDPGITVRVCDCDV